MLSTLYQNTPHVLTTSLKTDLSPDELKQESLVMTKQWQLIQSGVDRRLIKLVKQSLYVTFKLYGKVVNTSFNKTEGSTVPATTATPYPSPNSN